MNLLTVEQIATYLDVSKRRVYQLIKKGILPVVRLGAQIRVSEDAYRDWVLQGGKGIDSEVRDLRMTDNDGRRQA